MKKSTPEHRRHEEHCKRCRVCRVGGQCREALGLLIDADSADFRRFEARMLAERAALVDA